MTTFEEISTCQKANRKFWTERARLNLACWQENRHTNQPAARLDKAGFKANMRARRQQKFFSKPQETAQ